jgi:YhcH/YjgK/YiaL family protein
MINMPVMKNPILNIAVLAIFFLLAGCHSPSDKTSDQPQKQLQEWFNAGIISGEKTVKFDASIDSATFSRLYSEHPDRWLKAFEFIENNDLDSMTSGRYDIMDDTVYAMISEYETVDPSAKHFEAHRRYADIQYVISGREMIGLSPLADTTETFQVYDPSKDIGFYASASGIFHKAGPEELFIFFPRDMHKPGISDGNASEVKKLVIKVMTD